MVDTLSIVSLNSVKLVCSKLFFLSRLCLEEVAGIDVFEYCTFQLISKEYLIAIIEYCSFLCYQFVSEHFAGNRVTL